MKKPGNWQKIRIFPGKFLLTETPHNMKSPNMYFKKTGLFIVCNRVYVILHQKVSRKHKRWFSVLPVLSKIFTKNMKLLQILAKVIKILKNGLLCFLFVFWHKIRLKEKSIKKYPDRGLNPWPHSNCSQKATLFYPTPLTANNGTT